MKIREVIQVLDKIAPFFLQEEFDNSGVQFADLDEETNRILLCLDLTEEILEEAIEKNCNVIISHHPLIFHPLTKITKQDNPVIFKLIKNHINLIAVHTNYDISEQGLNYYVAKLLDLEKTGCLNLTSEKTYKLAIYVPEKYQKQLLEALFKAGAGNIGNYSETSFSSTGMGTFKPMNNATPFIGKPGERELVSEVKVETLFLERNLKKIIETIHQHHPYEEPAYDIYQIIANSITGIGMIARLDSVQTLETFSKKIKKALGIPYLRITKANDKLIQTVALCTGSGGSLIDQCIKKQVDVFITGDIDHHEALKAKELGLNIIDVEHFYTESFFVPSIHKQLIKYHIPEKLLIDSQKMKPAFQIL